MSDSTEMHNRYQEHYYRGGDTNQYRPFPHPHLFLFLFSVFFFCFPIGQEEITEADERAMQHFLAPETAPTRTLADMIMAKIREKEIEAGITPSHPGERRGEGGGGEGTRRRSRGGELS